MLLVKTQVVHLIPDHQGSVFLVPLTRYRERCPLNEQRVSLSLEQISGRLLEGVCLPKCNRSIQQDLRHSFLIQPWIYL